MKRVPVCFALLFIIFQSFATPPASFTKAKQIALSLFSDHTETLYCGCHWNSTKDINLHSCHMEDASSHSRSHTLEWEHMVPASHLGEGRACWTEDLCKNSKGHAYHGRSCCRIIDKVFRQREAELYNLWPSDGLINQLRQNYPYAALPFANNTYGCRFIIDGNAHLVEPDDKAKGIVARASLFMAAHHNIHFEEEDLALFEKWNTLYPPSDWEKKWARLVQKTEGYENPYITEHA